MTCSPVENTFNSVIDETVFLIDISDWRSSEKNVGKCLMELRGHPYLVAESQH